MEISRNKAIAIAIALSLEGIAVGIGISYFLDLGPESVITEEKLKVVEVEKQVVVEREKLVETKTTPVLPNWHISVLGGVAPRFDQPPLTPVMVGVEVERRAIGPFFAGGWIMGGSPVVGPFTLTNAAFGIKLGAEF